MIAPRWNNQDTYAAGITALAIANDVPVPVAFGLIAQESGFDTNAIRQEPAYHCASTGQTGDASYGLTQLLYCTALGLGYSGNPLGLLDPTTNVSLGLMYFGQLIAAHGGDIAAALSAYNGGDRPSLGYGAVRPDGTFANQAYVDNVLSNAGYFDGYLSQQTAGVDVNDASADDGDGTSGGDAESPGSATPLLVAASAAAITGLGWLILRAIRHH